MSLYKQLVKQINAESEKLSLRHHAYHNALHIENQRKKQRSYNPSLKKIMKPTSWAKDKKFNPFYVKKNAKAIAFSIAKKIKNKTYFPHDPDINTIPKTSGGYREVAIYQIPDAAVSTLFYQRLLSKNKHRFSSYSYAYRNDRNVHFAIQDIAVSLSNSSRLFVAEFDFSKFFDTISHEYLYNQFNQNGFFISDEEQYVICSFLKQHSKNQEKNDLQGKPCKKGIPQGTSISLFLANLACWQLDKNLEREGLQFARYADDTIIWSNDYTKITKAIDIMNLFSKKIGVKLNPTKSEGISILCPRDMKSEFYKNKESIEFLGYSLSIDDVSIKEASVIKIKRDISYILYKHLIQPLMSHKLTAVKIPANNRDDALVSALSEIRRYLYGNLSDKMLHSYLKGRTNRIFFKGLMSFYPLINNEKQIKELDGWLVNAVFKAIQKRSKLLVKHNHPRTNRFPFNLSRKNYLKAVSRKSINRADLYVIPSFIKIHKAIEKGLLEQGISGIINPNKKNYY